MRSQVGRKTEELCLAEIDRQAEGILSGGCTPEGYHFSCGIISGLRTAIKIMQEVEEDREK